MPPESLDEETLRYVPNAAQNIFRTLAHHPKLLKRWLVFGAHVLAKNSLDERQRELVILRTGWRCRAEYEFGQHTLIAADVITSDEVTALTRPLDAHDWSTLERALLTAADELVDDHCITDGTWAALAEGLSTEQLMDLIFTVGQYSLVSMALNSLGVPLDDGAPGWPEGTTD